MCLKVILRELTSKGKDCSSRDPRSELGYRLTIQVDPHDSARPLAVLHVPSLGNKVREHVVYTILKIGVLFCSKTFFLVFQESEIADRAIRSELLSMERLLVHTIYVRTRSRLNDLKTEFQVMLKDVECRSI